MAFCFGEQVRQKIGINLIF